MEGAMAQVGRAMADLMLIINVGAGKGPLETPDITSSGPFPSTLLQFCNKGVKLPFQMILAITGKGICLCLAFPAPNLWLAHFTCTAMSHSFGDQLSKKWLICK